MPLVIETGSGVAGANSYASVAEARAYASARGLTLPATDAAVETALILAADKLETYRFKGNKTAATQALAWPRSDVYIENADTALADDEIPEKLKQAQCQFAFDSTLTDLQPTGTGREVLREKVDVIETEYAKRGSGTIAPRFTKAEALLAPLLLNGGAFGLSTYRL